MLASPSKKDRCETVASVLHELEKLPVDSDGARGLQQVVKLVASGGLHNLEPLLPLVLSLNGQPFTLRNHFHFQPIFKCNQPRKTILKTGRQTGKSQSISALMVLLSACIPYFKTLAICPLYEQIRRLSNNYVRPLIESSPIRALLVHTGTTNSVLQRSFRNGSIIQFSFALLDTSRLRGISTHFLVADEFQDLDPTHLPIIVECLTASPWDIRLFAGTSKSLDNNLQSQWLQSSQAEFFIPCTRCGKWNIPAAGYHIEAMIGPLHDHISERYPAIVCYNCRAPLYARLGRWVHRRPQLVESFAGYHIPQIILPLHYARYDRWQELLAKQSGAGNMTTYQFYNEVLGEAMDSGQKLVTETELRAAAVLPWKNNPNQPAQELMQMLPHYRMLVMGCDWGGGGEEGVSFTVLALLGLTPTGQIHCLWGKRLLLANEHIREAEECIRRMNQFGAQLFAHDYTGAGIVRETVMVQAGMDLTRLMPFQYIRAARGDLIRFVPPSPLHNRHYYQLDKTRSLLYVCQAIKTGLLQFFEYDGDDPGANGLIPDFLALVEEKASTRHAGDVYMITKAASLTDDFAQAVNIGCAALWHANDAWPNFAEAAKIASISPRLLKAVGDFEHGWEQDSAYDW